MDSVIHLLHQVTHHGIWLIVFAVLLFLLSLTKRKLLAVAILLLTLAVLNLLFGHRFTNSLVYQYGKNGTALIIGAEKTSDIYTYRSVTEYRVLIQTGDNGEVHATFRSNDFNIYPTPKTRYTYPRQGIPFAVKYVESRPEIFIIVSQ